MLGSVLHVHIVFRQPTQGLRVYRSGLKLGCQGKQWQCRGSEGCCSGELREGHYIRYPLRRWFHKVRVTPAPFVKPPLPQPCILVIIIISTLTVSIMGIVIWMLLSSSAFEHVEVSLGQECSHHPVYSNTNVITAWAWMLLSSSALEHERYHGLGMDAPVSVCSGNTNVTMVWTWMLSRLSALEHERYYGLGMDALVTVCCWKRRKIVDAFDNITRCFRVETSKGLTCLGFRTLNPKP